MKKLSGGCRCKAIRYECVSEPLAVSFCYCRDCQQASGGPFCNYAVVPAGAVTITKGQPKSYTVQADSGNTVQREFCAECGAPQHRARSRVPRGAARAAPSEMRLNSLAVCYCQARTTLACFPCSGRGYLRDSAANEGRTSQGCRAFRAGPPFVRQIRGPVLGIHRALSRIAPIIFRW